jgi:hypothetical protein
MASRLTQKQNEKWVFKLTAEERRQLEAIVRKPTAAAGKVAKARALLMTDASDGQTPATDEAIAQEVHVTSRSIASWRKRACEDGPLESLERRPKSPGPTPPSLTEKWKRNSCDWPARKPQQAASGGACGCWLRSWWNWRLSKPSRVRRSARLSKKRSQAVAQKALVHPAEGRRGLRSGHGTSAGRLSASVGSDASGRVHGRAAQATH